LQAKLGDKYHIGIVLMVIQYLGQFIQRDYANRQYIYPRFELTVSDLFRSTGDIVHVIF
jgi:hypothetical protein